MRDRRFGHAEQSGKIAAAHFALFERMQNAQALIDTDKPDSPVSTAQIKRLYAIGGEAGMNAAEVKQILVAQGYTSTKQIKQKDYDNVIDLIKKKGETE